MIERKKYLDALIRRQWNGRIKVIFSGELRVHPRICLWTAFNFFCRKFFTCYSISQ